MNFSSYLVHTLTSFPCLFSTKLLRKFTQALKPTYKVLMSGKWDSLRFFTSSPQYKNADIDNLI